MTDSDSMPLDHSRQRRRVTFDPTINLGHLLTFVGFIATGAVGYFDLRERITLNEERTARVQSEVLSEKARTSESIREMREDVREVRNGVNILLHRKDK